ncbi:histidine phosphatase family protein [Nostoc sp.]
MDVGYEGFEEMLHSHNEAPPAGEKIGQVYDRAASFYEERVVPHLERGENVLVVCHQYVLEPLALYLSNLPPTAYKHLKLPNGKALSRDELVKFRNKESGGAASLRKQINDLSIMWAIASKSSNLLWAVECLKHQERSAESSSASRSHKCLSSGFTSALVRR